MIKKTLLCLSIVVFTLQTEAQIYSQLYSGKQEMFLEAEAFHLFEEFNEALPIYLELLADQPDNAFLNYRIGTCYLSIPGEKDMAVSYLEKAIENIDSRSRRPNFRTTSAPVDAIFYLGEAYHVNYMFDKALEKYHEFREILDPSVYSIEIVDEHILATKNAIESTKNPVFFKQINLGPRINTRFSETNPTVSGNGQVLVFTRKLQFYDGIFFSGRNEDGEWSWPVEITGQIGSDGDSYPVSLTYDGRELYLYKSDDLIGNIYSSRYENGQWSPVRKLNSNINTNYWESHASISRDGNTLYFSSNRPGGYGDLDIYYSRRTGGGDWGPAVNMGPAINTPYNDDTPIITEDGKTLYFSSYGHYNIGGYDVFYSTLMDNGQWSPPLNAGYGISTPDDDLFFNPLNNGIYAFVSKFDDGGFGGMDIFQYEIFSDAHPRKFRLSGILGRHDGFQLGPSARITVYDKDGDTLQSLHPDRLTGEYEIILEAGEWEIAFDEDQHDRIVRPIILPIDMEDDEISIDVMLSRSEPELTDPELITDRILLPESMRAPKTLGITRHEYDVTTAERIRIPMRLERNTYLEVEKYLDGELTDTEKISVNRRRFTYEYIPVPGENILRFIYTDRDGDVITEDVTIRFYPPDYIRDLEIADSIIARMIETASASLLDALLELDNELLRLSTPEQLLEYLSGKDAFRDMDERYNTVEEFARALIPLVSDELAAFLKKLIDEGNLPGTIDELIEMINAASEGSGFDKWEVYPALATISAGDEAIINAIIAKLIEESSGSLRDALLGIDSEAINITTPEQLLEYLAGRSAFSDLYERYGTVEEFARALIPFVSKELAAFLQMLIDENRLPDTIEELIAMIIAASEEFGFDKWEIFFALAKMSADDAPVTEMVVADPEEGVRGFCWWWIILLIILILAAYYYSTRKRKGNKS